jgi:hypothetical protein
MSPRYRNLTPAASRFVGHVACALRVDQHQGGAAARHRVRRSPRRALPWEARPARPRRPSPSGPADLAGYLDQLAHARRAPGAARLLAWLRRSTSAVQPCNGPVGVEGDGDHARPIGPRDGYLFEVELALSGKRRRTVASIRAQHILAGGPGLRQGQGPSGFHHRWVELALHGRELPSRQVSHDLARREANGPRDGGEVPAPPLLQAARKHTTASDPSAAAQRFMAHPVPHPGGSTRSRVCTPPGARQATPARVRRSTQLTPDAAGPA